MQEGWLNDDYLILFEDEHEAEAAARPLRPCLDPSRLPSYWAPWRDEFLVVDKNGDVFSVPTVPLDRNDLAPFQMPSDAVILERDDRFVGKIKWYVKPVVFGGDPRIGDNLVWVSHEEHAQLVRWWNEQYRALKSPV
jgi:hypothetical protein